MDGTRSQCACGRTVKVGRSFEWSRLENELMTLAYERVLPVGGCGPDQQGLGRWTQTESPLSSYEHDGNAFGRSDCDRRRYATGA
jgi:hypothetical protein